ncbi:MAG: peptidylprolyl isomerase [Kiritimatiellia bacterium]
MFIYHFHRIIRNKIFWGAFAILISFTFVAVDSCSTPAPQSRIAGKLAGKAVTYERFEEAANAIRGFGRNRSTLPAAQINRRAWERLAALHTARNLGIRIGDDEIAAAIREQFAAPDGSFRYQTYEETLRQAGLTVPLYERLMRDELALAKLTAVLATAALPSNMEVDTAVANFTDEFDLQTVLLDNTFAGKDMGLKEADWRKFFAENGEKLALPDRRSIRYFAIPVTNWLAAGQALVTDEDIQEYYDSNTEKYTYQTTNGTAVTPLEKVKPQILRHLGMIEAAYIAETNLNQSVVPDIMDTSFEAVARKLGCSITNSALFSAKEPPAIRADGAAIAEVAFELDMSRADTSYGVAKGAHHFYLLTVDKDSPAHNPTYEEALHKVKPLASEKARNDAYDAYASNTVVAIRAALAKGSSFSNALAAAKVKVSGATNFTFSMTAPQKVPNLYSVIRAVRGLHKGELSDATPVYGAPSSLLVYVADRREGDPVSAEMQRGRIQQEVSRPAAARLSAAWLEWNLEQVGLTDNAMQMPQLQSAETVAGEDEE